MNDPTRAKWELIIERDKPIHRYSIRVITPKPFYGPELATVNPYMIVHRESLGKMIAATPELIEALKFYAEISPSDYSIETKALLSDRGKRAREALALAGVE